MKALLIKVDFNTGKRAGNINPKDKNLPCHGWQNLDDGWEIRIIDDNRDISIYSNIDGITILKNQDAINNAIDSYIPEQYTIFDSMLLLEHMKEKKISLDIFTDKTMKEIAREASDLHLAGVTKRKQKKV